MIESVAMLYIFVGVYTSMLWPMARGVQDNMGVRFRKEGETGLEFIAKASVVVFLWPILWLSGAWHVLNVVIIPWLFNEA